LTHGEITNDEPDKPKTLKVKQAKVKSSKQLVEKKVKKAEREINELNQETKKLLWDEEREVSIHFVF